MVLDEFHYTFKNAIHCFVFVFSNTDVVGKYSLKMDFNSRISHNAKFLKKHAKEGKLAVLLCVSFT